VSVAILLAGGWWSPALSQQGSQPAKAGTGRAIFESRCAACHGLDARGGEALGIGRGSAAASFTDARLRTILHDGLPRGMPAFGSSLSDADLNAVLHYLRDLQRATAASGAADAASGDAAKGRALFFGKAACAQCHMAQGQGGFLAGDLTGLRLDAGEIRRAIVSPSASAKTVRTTVTFRDGQTIAGITRNEDNFSIQVQDERGAFHLIDKSIVTNVVRDAQPLMPGDYGQRLSAAELRDLVGYLAQIGTPATPAKPR